MVLSRCGLPQGPGAEINQRTRPMKRNVPDPELSLTPLDGNTALRTLNVTVSGDYATADPATVAAFKAAQDVSAVGVSVDTTHGVVRTVCDSPFLFISPIVNRLTAFNTETLPNFFP